jgi:hypothetical protein
MPLQFRQGPGLAVQPGDPELNGEDQARLQYRLTEYLIKASIPIIGDIGRVGTMAIEEEVRRDGNKLNKVFRMYGNSKPEMAAKGRDYGGEFKMVKRLPLDDRGEVDREALEEWRGVESSYSGYLRKNGKIEGENVVFFPDGAVATRENGTEKRIQGDYGSLLSALEYFFENDIKAGDVFESKFILNGYPYIFKCEVGKPDVLAPYRARAFRIDVTTYDGLLKDGQGNPKIRKKKGGIRLWLSKEGDFRNRVLRLKIHYRWYLTLSMELSKTI